LRAAIAAAAGVRIVVDLTASSYFDRSGLRVLLESVLGFVVKSLFWLAIVGIVLFIATAAFGAVRRGRVPR
jgi:hypothetical protein